MKTLISALFVAGLLCPTEASARNLIVGRCETAGVEAKVIIGYWLYNDLPKSHADHLISLKYMHAHLRLTDADRAYIRRMIDEAYEVEKPRDFRTREHAVDDFAARARTDCEKTMGVGAP